MAVVGIGCRLPGGADDAESFWRLLREGTDAVRPIPDERGKGVGGELSYSRYMGALDGIDRFDAGFFGISPREAASMDPQHRLLLEVAWEAIENAAWSPVSLAGSQTGVWIGIYSDDYAQERLYRRAAAEIDGHAGLGMMRSLAAGRIAYHLDLHGPVLALDTACSSSLLAIHLACRSLRAGECDRALAGGVSLALSPEITLGLCRMGALSPSGRCRTFSADADGFVRGEGCGVVALRRLDDALAAGDPVIAVIRGSAVNHDGRSNGISAPNGAAQRSVIRAALAEAGVEGRSIGYVEAHGTGTRLGDPIELRALGDAYGSERAAPLVIGSVKTNLGHLEAAAGVAGFMKAALAVNRAEIPSNLHFASPNPLIPWDGLGMEVATGIRPWGGPEPRRAGISAFGMSGTNVHMVIEAPPLLREEVRGQGPWVLALSVRSEAALGALAQRHAAALEARPGIDPAAVAATLNTGRAMFPVRAAFVFEDVEGLMRQLRGPLEPVVAPARPPALVFRFHGHGAGGAERLADALSAVRELEALGLHPAHVIGFGFGEIAAACCAGVLGPGEARQLLQAREAALAQADREAGRFAFLRALRTLHLSPPGIPLVSGMLGRAIGAEATSPAYWWQQLGHAPDPEAAMAALGGNVLFLDVEKPLTRMEACRLLARLHLAGVPIDWARAHAAGRTRRIALPSYPFDRQRHFIERPAVRSDVAEVPSGLAGAALSLAGSAERRFVLTLGAAHAYLRDHRVGGGSLLPASAFAEIAAQNALAARPGRISAVERLSLLRPLPLRAGDGTEIQTVVAEDGGWSLYARPGADGEWTLHATARLADVAAGMAPPEAEATPAQRIEGAEIYAALARQGIEPGPAFRSLEWVERRGEAALAAMTLPDAAGPSESYLLHPALLDGGLVGCSAILPGLPEGTSWLPAGMDRLRVHGAAGSAAAVMARLRAADGERAQLDLRVLAEGRVVAEIEGLAFVRSKPRAGAVAEPHLLRPHWQPAPLPAGGNRARRFVLTGDDAAALAALEEALGRQGHAVTLFREEETQDADAMHRRIAEAMPGVVVADLAFAVADPAGGVPASYGRHLRLVQALGPSAGRSGAQLVLVTRGSQRVGMEEVPAVAEAGLWGLSRVAAREYPDLPITRLDLDAGDALPIRELARFLPDAPSGEEIAFRQGQAFQAELSAEGPAPPVELPIFDGAPPGPGEVTIEVMASGLNFRDVLHGMGLLADSAARMPYGLECAGFVTAVGADVAGLRPGQPVIAGLTVGSLADRVTVPAAFVVPKPPGLSFRDAATLPLAFLTAHYGLDRLAGLKAGERVLIHAAAGGVGQAAIQVARRAGAEIFATASPGKWNHLRRQGIAHLFDSRRPDFAGEVRRLTGGRGVDVVLNSLGGEAIAASFAALADGGRFVEIGRMDIWSRRQVEELGRGIAYFPFDLWDVKQDQTLVAAMMAEMAARLGDGTLAPLRSELFPIGRAGAAFQHMARARHIGKIVLWQAPAGRGGLIRSDGVYLVTGGLGALGLHAARWLVSRGARRVVLAGRRPPSPGAAQAVEALRALGAEVEVRQADLGARAGVARLRAGLPPLSGVIHAAGLVNDAVIARQDEARFAEVLAPKLTAAWHLHEALREDPLDFFLLYASASGLLGTPGQANYAAANAALDAFAHHRAALGLPALAVDWGPWAGEGMARSLRDEGIARIDPAAADAVLDRLLLERQGQVAVLPEGPARMLPRAAAPAVPAQAPALRAELERAPLADRRRLLRAHAGRLVAALLELPPGQAVDPARPLEELGFDSLMNLELKTELDRELGVELRQTLAFDFPTVDALVAHLAEDVMKWTIREEPGEAPSGAPDLKGELLAELRALNY